MMYVKWKWLLREWGIMVLVWIFIFYFYYLVVYWGNTRFLRESFFLEYLFSYKIHLEFTLTSIFFGLLFGVINTIIDSTSIRKRSFSFIILFKSISYLLATILVSMLVYAFFHALDIFPQEVFNEMKKYISFQFVFSFFLYLSFFIIFVNIALQLNKKFGPGELIRIISGKYHQPKEESRAFLFIDMKDSTSTAEKLGNILYSQLIRQCFIDLSEFILKYGSSIYQHVGDEIVLTWEEKKAFKKLNAISLFFDFNERLKQKAPYYIKKFGVVPFFKAALHMGKIVVTETGDLKREIAYHGDVINTTARLEKQCNKYKAQLLISEIVKNKIEGSNGYYIDFLDEIVLKGKKSSIKIFRLSTTEKVTY